MVRFVFRYTTALNRTALKLAHGYPKLLRRSFDVGIIASICLIPLILLWQMKPYIVDAVASLNTVASGQSGGDSTKQDSSRSSSNNAIQFDLMLPGVNLPIDEISYYAIS